MKYQTIDVDGIKIFYREAGDPAKPILLLLHGFPSASHMFRDLMPALEDHFHLIAPDYPGFGQSQSPDRDHFTYTFDHLAQVMDHFLDQLKIDQFLMYVFDYGAPIGFRLASWHPEKIAGIISQNGNIYEEGLGPKWAQRAEYWQHPTSELRRQYQSAFAKETVIGQYTYGTPAGSVSPDGYSLDLYYAATIDDYAEKQSDLIFDYQSNVRLYPQFQAYLRQYQPKLLAIWGKEDPSFIWAGAEAFKKDLPAARIIPVASGHFALENCCPQIATEIINFFG
ncbi:alpha/beta fold hydrolase [Limosilactobacillus gastricus]|uniref:alpha/beta fold hydrolase n=1 Tax=Limosilactobacillus gastricus TaxID=227942 RepID=UPI0026EE38F0|nr:alpha/beta hydrolase [Limosilactobacillus gastricus]